MYFAKLWFAETNIIISEPDIKYRRTEENRRNRGVCEIEESLFQPTPGRHKFMNAWNDPCGSARQMQIRHSLISRSFMRSACLYRVHCHVAGRGTS